MTPHFQAIRQQALATTMRAWQKDDPRPARPFRRPLLAAWTDVERLVMSKAAQPAQTPVQV